MGNFRSCPWLSNKSDIAKYLHPQPLVFDLLPTEDGLYRDGDANIAGSDSSSSAPRHDICLTADHPAEWERIRYLPLPKVLEELQTETKFKVPVSRESKEYRFR